MKVYYLKTGLLTILLTVSISSFISAQKFVEVVNNFSKKKITYITMDDGSEIKGNIKDLDAKKGLIEKIKILDADGKKLKITPDDINYMYVAPTAVSKLGSTIDLMKDASRWEDTDLDKDIINKGYVYLEKSDVRIRKKTRTLMVQLLNPSFSSKIKVYNDPITGETASVGIGGVKLAGGLAKSYFVKKAGEKVAFELKKKNYDEEFKLIFSDCPALIEKYGDNPKWADLEKHVIEYSQCK